MDFVEDGRVVCRVPGVTLSMPPRRLENDGARWVEIDPRPDHVSFQVPPWVCPNVGSVYALRDEQGTSKRIEVTDVANAGRRGKTVTATILGPPAGSDRSVRGPR